MENNQEEWSRVSGKRAAKGTRAGDVRKLTGAGVDPDTVEPADIIKLLAQCREALLSSTYFHAVCAVIQSQVDRSCHYDGIFGLGIGCLASPTSQLQLAIYLCLCERFIKPNALTAVSRGVFDPLTTSSDRSVYDILGIPVLTENTKGKQKVEGKVLFFLPHCPYRLYCNLIWANWEHLDRVHIFGNSFQSYSLRREQTALAAVTDKKARRKGKLGADLPPPAVPADPSDTVAILTPYMKEVDLWPSPGAYKAAGSAVGVRTGSSGSSAEVEPKTTAVTDSGDPAAKPAVPDKTVFLREARSVRALQHLENAVCDMSFMHLDETAPRDVLARLKPAEDLIDAACANDVELF